MKRKGATKKVDLPSSNSPEAKQIKVEEMLKWIKVEKLEDEQIVWVAFTRTRIQLIMRIN